MTNFAFMKSLSILIPEYKDLCVEQLKALSAQCRAVADFSWEIIITDDGTPLESALNTFSVNDIYGCKLLMRHNNYGRSSTRNFLAHEAMYDTLLYIDSGLMPNPHFVEKYVENIGKAQVVCGNIAVDKDCIDLTNLRCKNELKAEKRFTSEKHAKEPYKNFHSGNFMIDRKLILDNPFREDIKTYGYEDTLFGKQLYEKKVSILHINNPVLFVRFESNARFLEKTKEGINTLYKYREEIEGYSPLLHFVNKLKDYHLLWIPHIIYSWLVNIMESNLKGNNPSLFVFSLYRVCLLSKLIL